MPVAMLGRVSSMTGFAHCSASGATGDLTWEIKSVNAKGLDLRLRYPQGHEGDEPVFRGLISASIARGSVQAVLTAGRATAGSRVRVNDDLLRRLAEAILTAVPATVGDRLGPLTLDGLLSVRGVVEIEEGEDPRAVAREARPAVLALLEQALGVLSATRNAEGLALKALMLAHLDALDEQIEAADRAPGRTAQAVLQRLKRSVGELWEAVPALDPARLHQEAVLLAMRADVREEIDRLRVHCRAARTLLAEGGAVGRRLDFLAQELSREANTLCAKSNDPDLTAIGLSMRNQIEQMREQVQNLE